MALTRVISNAMVLLLCWFVMFECVYVCSVHANNDESAHAHTQTDTFTYDFDCSLSSCDDQNACTHDYCDAMLGCVHKDVVCDGICVTERETSQHVPHTYTHDYDFVLLIEHPNTPTQAALIQHSLTQFVKHALSSSLPHPYTHTYTNVRIAVARYNYPLHTHTRQGDSINAQFKDSNKLLDSNIEVLSPFSHSIPLTLSVINDALSLTEPHTNTHSSPLYTLKAIDSFLKLSTGDAPGMIAIHMFQCIHICQ